MYEEYFVYFFFELKRLAFTVVNNNNNNFVFLPIAIDNGVLCLPLQYHIIQFVILTIWDELAPKLNACETSHPNTPRVIRHTTTFCGL